MTAPARTIRIAAALIQDGDGRMLLVRKAGSRFYMQAGGKIEPGEAPLAALARELDEEIGIDLTQEEVRHVGSFAAPAANEPDHIVEAEIFHLRTTQVPAARAEIEEALWVTPAEAARLQLAPLTRAHVLPVARRLC